MQQADNNSISDEEFEELLKNIKKAMRKAYISGTIIPASLTMLLIAALILAAETFTLPSPYESISKYAGYSVGWSLAAISLCLALRLAKSPRKPTIEDQLLVSALRALMDNRDKTDD